MATSLGIGLGKFAFADVARLVVEFGFDVSTGKDDAVPEVIAVTIPSERDGVVTVTTTSTTFDVRKQTSHAVSNTSIQSS